MKAVLAIATLSCMTLLLGCAYSENVAPETDHQETSVPTVVVPERFTPDGDGVNDVLEIDVQGVSELLLTIYNRWGEVMFRTTDPEIFWDGTTNGKDAPPDLYGYQLLLTGERDAEIKQKGNIALLR